MARGKVVEKNQQRCNSSKQTNKQTSSTPPIFHTHRSLSVDFLPDDSSEKRARLTHALEQREQPRRRLRIQEAVSSAHGAGEGKAVVGDGGDELRGRDAHITDRAIRYLVFGGGAKECVGVVSERMCACELVCVSVCLSLSLCPFPPRISSLSLSLSLPLSPSLPPSLSLS